MMPNILLTDCIEMDRLIQSHRKWNSGVDWFVGSPTYGVAQYMLCDHNVLIHRRTITLKLNCELQDMQYVAPISFMHMEIVHDDLLLEARWSFSRQYYGVIHHEHLEYVTWEGDAWLFTEWLMEFQLLNSLTAKPITL